MITVLASLTLLSACTATDGDTIRCGDERIRWTSAGHDRLDAMRIEAIGGHATDSLVLPNTRHSQL